MTQAIKNKLSFATTTLLQTKNSLFANVNNVVLNSQAHDQKMTIYGNTMKAKIIFLIPKQRKDS